jgi:hypothetical protein
MGCDSIRTFGSLLQDISPISNCLAMATATRTFATDHWPYKYPGALMQHQVTVAVSAAALQFFKDNTPGFLRISALGLGISALCSIRKGAFTDAAKKVGIICLCCAAAQAVDCYK